MNSNAEVKQLIARADVARRENRPTDAHADLTRALALSRESCDKNDLLQSLKKLGQIESDRNRGDLALPMYEEAVAIARELARGDGQDASTALVLAHTVRHLGDIHLDAGRPQLAEPCYIEALEIYRSNPESDTLDLANAIRPFAILKDESGNLDEAKKLWTEARDLYAAVNVEAGVEECSR
ncbi:MAG: acetyltransferase, family [Acidobacteriales bacterium]|nr:acetyltransferase, family [Terriglobales bacterium]